jgi:hypothetical protein
MESNLGLNPDASHKGARSDLHTPLMEALEAGLLPTLQSWHRLLTQL